MPVVSLVERIQSLCEREEISVPALETKLGLSKGSIYKWHDSSPKVSSIQKVAKYFNVTIDSLLAETIPIEDINNLDEETKKIITDQETKPYILLTKKALEQGIPIDVLETLIKIYTPK